MGAQFGEILLEYVIGFGMSVLTLLVVLVFLDNMTVGDGWPVLGLMEGFVVTDQYAGAFKGRKGHKM